MIDMSTWMPAFLQKLDAAFGDRVWFVGLQGSYGRGEATETSDIDMVVILDELHAQDLTTYRTMLDTLPDREMICGFFAGKEELLQWDAADLFQFYHDTTPIRGSMDALLLLLDQAAVDRAIKMGACNLFHGCVHSALHGRSMDALKALYKSASFVVQALVYRQTGVYYKLQKELLEAADAKTRQIVSTFIRFKQGETVDYDEASMALIHWAQRLIRQEK